MRGRGLRLAVLAASLTTTAPAVAATVPAGGQATPAPVTMAGAGATETVSYGEPVLFAGAVASRAAGRTVRLEYAPRDGSGWQLLAHSQTAANGGYWFSIRARRSGSYRVAETAGASAARNLTVRAQVRAEGTRHVLGDRKVRVRGRVNPGIRGRRVSLQRAYHGRWKTVDRTRTRGGGGGPLPGVV